MIYQGKAQYPVTTAVLHCAAINTGQFDGMRPIQVYQTVDRWHRERGFRNGFGYHALFMPDGQMFNGRPLSQIGAHVIDHNRGTLGFLMIESRKITRIGEFGDWFTDEQKEAVRSLLARIPGLERVKGHNDFAPRLCPGFKVRSDDWL